MANAAARSCSYDRHRQNPGPSERARAVALEARRATARNKYHAKKRAEHSSHGESQATRPRRGRSDRALRDAVLSEVRRMKEMANGDTMFLARLMAGIFSHSQLTEARKLGGFMSQKEELATKILLKNLQEGLQSVKGTHSQDDVIAKQSCLNMCISQATLDNRLGKTTSNILNIHSRNIRISALRRSGVLSKDGVQIGKWAGQKPGRKARSDQIHLAIKELVLRWWTEKTRVSPIAKNVLKRQDNHPIHFLKESQTEFYLEFKKENSRVNVGDEDIPVKIGQTSFCALKPAWVRKEKDRNICCCKYHVELSYLKDAFNSLRRSHNLVPGRSCGCEALQIACNACLQPLHEWEASKDRHILPSDSRRPSSFEPEDTSQVELTFQQPVVFHSSQGSQLAPACKAHEKIFSSVRSMMSTMLCPKVYRESSGTECEYWNLYACIMGLCDKCGINQWKNSICQIFEASISHPHFGTSFPWKSYGYVSHGMDSEGKERKHMELKHNTSSPAEFMDYLCEKLPEFVRHDFTARWQDKQYRLSLQSFPKDVVLSVIDYAENYTFLPKDEIQSEHWTSKTVTILVHISYYHLPESTEENRVVEKEVHFYISDDKNHDSAFIQHAFKIHRKHLADHQIQYNQHWVWSDGAPTQFKNSTNFFFVSRYPQYSNGISMMWNFFGTGHGKGEHDGQGAIVKNELKRHQLKGTEGRFDQAEDVVEHCRAALMTGSLASYPKRNARSEKVKRVFWEVKEEDVDRSPSLSSAQTLDGCKKWHCFWGRSMTDPTLLQVREFTCMCKHCLVQDWDSCEWKEWVGEEWGFHNLHLATRTLPSDIRHIDAPAYKEDLIGWDFEHLSDALELGDIFVVQADPEDAEQQDYYLLRCTGVKQKIMDRTITCKWSNHTYTRGEVVVYGTYLKFSKSSKKGRIYEYTDDCSDAIHYSHLVRAARIKLENLPTTTKRKRSERFLLDNELHERLLDVIQDGEPVENAL